VECGFENGYEPDSSVPGISNVQRSRAQTVAELTHDSYARSTSKGVLYSGKFQSSNRSEEDTMSNTRTLLRGAAMAAITLILTFAALASADILDDWAKVQPPPPPELKSVKLDGATTAFLILDMVPPQCDHNPRCAATVPKIKQLHDAARKAGAMFWYAVPGRDAKPEE